MEAALAYQVDAQSAIAIHDKKFSAQILEASEVEQSVLEAESTIDWVDLEVEVDEVAC